MSLPIAMTIMVGCLKALAWLGYAIAALIAVLFVAQAWRGDPLAQPAATASFGAIMAAAGALCGLIARILQARLR